MGYDQFRRLMPGCRRLVQLGQVARTYVGPELDFDIQPVLRGDETPPCRLAADGEPPRLGWNTWVASVPRSRDAEDAVFVAEGLPTR
jgi:type VI secretion system protein ImpH